MPEWKTPIPRLEVYSLIQYCREREKGGGAGSGSPFRINIQTYFVLCQGKRRRGGSGGNTDIHHRVHYVHSEEIRPAATRCCVITSSWSVCLKVFVYFSVKLIQTNTPVFVSLQRTFLKATWRCPNTPYWSVFAVAAPLRQTTQTWPWSPSVRGRVSRQNRFMPKNVCDSSDALATLFMKDDWHTLTPKRYWRLNEFISASTVEAVQGASRLAAVCSRTTRCHSSFALDL